jgi:hypothetical protein
VLVAYRIPELRIADHFRWNDALYRQGRTTVYVVSDRRCPGPGYARWIVFPEADLPLRNGRRVFSLTATKNRGIDAALADGCQVLVVTDIDMAFPDPTWHRMTGCRRGEAIVPVYVLAPAFDSRVTCTAAAEDPGCEGTVAMTAADWRRVRFDERCIGYGADDGILHKAIARAGIRHDRQFRVYHIAHTPVAADSRVPGHGRGDCWNRADGFNPDNFAENRRLYDAHR